MLNSSCLLHYAACFWVNTRMETGIFAFLFSMSDSPAALAVAILPFAVRQTAVFTQFYSNTHTHCDERTHTNCDIHTYCFNWLIKKAGNLRREQTTSQSRQLKTG
jgi:hypothetical protein